MTATTDIKKMIQLYANSSDMKVEELEQSIVQRIESQTLYLAVMDTNYTTYAISDNALKAKRLALRSAKAHIDKSGFPMTLKDIEASIGCNVYAVPFNSAVQR